MYPSASRTEEWSPCALTWSDTRQEATESASIVNTCLGAGSKRQKPDFAVQDNFFTAPEVPEHDGMPSSKAQTTDPRQEFESGGPGLLF